MAIIHNEKLSKKKKVTFDSLHRLKKKSFLFYVGCRFTRLFIGGTVKCERAYAFQRYNAISVFKVLPDKIEQF